nr:ORF3b [Infectious bronchitis virus]
MSGLASSVFRP